MCITDFRNLLKKKCKDDDEWTHSAREQVCAAIHWRGFPFAAKKCWKLRAYELIEEAEQHMLNGTFSEWVPTQAIPQSAMYEARRLEMWGIAVVKQIEIDKFQREEKFERDDKSRELKKVHFQNWCMVSRTPAYIDDGTFFFLTEFCIASSQTDSYRSPEPIRDI